VSGRINSGNERVTATVLDVTVHVGLALLLVAWCFVLLRPFVLCLAWGAIIAIGSQTPYARLEAALGGRRWLAALLYTSLALVLVLIPILMLSDTLISASRALAEGVREGTVRIPPPPDRVARLPLVGGGLSEFWELASTNLQAALEKAGPHVKDVAVGALGIAGNVGLWILQLVAAVVIAGVLLAHGAECQAASLALARRLVGERGPELAQLCQNTIRSVTRGVLGVACIQAVLAGMGFLAMGIPGAGLLALLCLVLSVVQVSIAIIMLPIAIYSFSTHGTTAAVAFLAWSVFVGLIDNFLKPVLLGRGLDVPMIVIFLGAIGGFLAHGIIGLFVGAVVLVLGYTLLQRWIATSATDGW
jgi:predicted PurR-regulated permease PerM